MQAKYWLPLALLLTACSPTLQTPPPQTTKADTAENATKWGLLGTWQPDCQAALNTYNTAYTYSVRGGQLLLERALGPGSSFYSVTSAAVTRDGALDIVTSFNEMGSFENVIAKGKDGRIRVMQNKNLITGEITVTDGVVRTGMPTPWETRCR